MNDQLDLVPEALAAIEDAAKGKDVEIQLIVHHSHYPRLALRRAIQSISP